MPYNTALKRGELTDLRAGLTAVSGAETERGCVFFHAIERPLPPTYSAIVQRAACLYTDLAWRHGWEVFQRRACVRTGTYKDYLLAVARLVNLLRRPSFIVCEKLAAKILSHHDVRPIKLNGEPAWLAIAYADPVPAASTAELLKTLAEQYPSVYDFGCGYGNALKHFDYFVGSDIDRKCVAYVARELLHV